MSASCLVSHFHHNTTATQALEEKQQLQDLVGRKWNSIHMLHLNKDRQYLKNRTFINLADAQRCTSSRQVTVGV